MKASTFATLGLFSIASCAAIEKRVYAIHNYTQRSVNRNNYTVRTVNASQAEIGAAASVGVDVKVVANIKIITKLSADLTVTVKKIKLKGLIPLSPTTFATVVVGFKNIIAAAAKAAKDMATFTPLKKPLTKVQQKSIADALTAFVEVHIALLDVVIGKAGLLDKLGLVPVAVVLKGLEAIVDKLAFAIIALIPAYKAGSTASLRSLDVKIHVAQKAYSPANIFPLPIPTIEPTDPSAIIPVKGGLPATPAVDVPGTIDGATGQVGDLTAPVSGGAGREVDGDVTGEPGGISGGLVGGATGDLTGGPTGLGL